MLSDAVIAGHDAEYAAALAWVNRAGPRGTRRVCVNDLASALAKLTRTQGRPGGRAAAPARDPPSLDAGEITDKGYLNQRRTLVCRSAEVARLYADPPDPEVILPA